MGRSGQLIAKNDQFIELLISDERYKINTDGSILTNITVSGKISVNDVWRDATKDKNGYKNISYTSPSGERKKLSVHRIIYRKFIGILEEDLVINHKNGNRADNNVNNLELVTQSNNNFHQFEVLKRPATIGNKKISDDIAEAIRLDHRLGLSYNKLSEKYDLSIGSISCIINKKNWNRKDDSGYTFEYKTKLSFDLADKIREERKTGLTVKELMQKYQVGSTAIKDVLGNRTWVRGL
jgi:Mor family transcriptional regulator